MPATVTSYQNHLERARATRNQCHVDEIAAKPAAGTADETALNVHSASCVSKSGSDRRFNDSNDRHCKRFVSRPESFCASVSRYL